MGTDKRLSYAALIVRKRAGHGISFDESELSRQFIPHYESGARIRVKFPCGTVKSGTVGVTTGWRPVFLLMLTSRSHGSVWTLSDKCEIL